MRWQKDLSANTSKKIYVSSAQVITRLLNSETPVDFEGEYYQLREALLLPRPQRTDGPPILIGGNGPKLTLPLVARYASIWNALFIPAEEFSSINEHLDRLLLEQGRKPGEVKRTLMTGCIFGRDEAEVRRKVKTRSGGK